jgi:hypothetical protein
MRRLARDVAGLFADARRVRLDGDHELARQELVALSQKYR